MHIRRLTELTVGEALGPLRLEVSADANDRYWRGAGIDQPTGASRRLFPPMAANLTILLLQSAVAEPVLHTAQRLRCHRASDADVALTVTGRVAASYERRGRAYAVIEASITLPGDEALWSSTATFTPVTP
jgi:hypothetical protein